MRQFKEVFRGALAPAILEELAAMGMSCPTPVQELAVPVMLAGRNCVVVAPTGSGKTVAYAAPMVELLRREQTELRPSRPRGLIVLPTRELCMQVTREVKRLAKAVGKLRVESLVGGSAMRNSKRDVEDHKVDLLVCTPGVVLKLRQSERIFTSDVRRIVVDEADTMFSKGFREDLDALLLPIHAKGAKIGRPPHCVAVAATLTARTQQRVERSLMGGASAVCIRAPGTHHVPVTLREQWIRIATHDKMPALVDALEGNRWSKCLVFVGSPDCARAVEHHLNERGVRGVRSFHAEIPAQMRKEWFAEFVKGDKCRLLVCTDAASRGLDLADVDLVINYDFAPTVADYIHRAGRTARMGRQGRCVSLIQTKRDRAVASAIQQNKDMTEALEDHVQSRSGENSGTVRRQM